MPILMRIGIAWSLFFASIWVAFIPLALSNIGTYELSGRTVTGRYFLVHAYPALSPMIAVLIGIAYGFSMERRWARSLPIWFWGSLGLLVFLPSGTGEAGWADVVGGWLTLGLLAALAGWYCYGKASVQEYYRALAAAIDARGA